MSEPKNKSMTDALYESVFFDTEPGIQLHAKVSGPVDAPVLLFIHGFPEFWYAWREQLSDLGRDYRCVALDLRGFNLSSQPAPLEAYKPAKILADVCAVIHALGAPVHGLIAHDWGGAVAWSLAAQHPQLLKKFAILNSPHTLAFAHALAHDPEQIAASLYMNWLRKPGSEDALAKNQFQLLCAMADIHTPDDLAAYRACWSKGLTGGCNYYRASPLHPDDPDLPAQVGRMAALAAQLHAQADNFKVKVPTQVIWGEADTALRPVLLEGLSQWVSDVRIHRISGAGHWLARTHASEVNRVLREFLA
jgi:pimeloyl-ACP methyl ester carboxylesterase